MKAALDLALLGTGWVVRNAYLSHLRRGHFRVVSAYDPEPQRLAAVVGELDDARPAATEEELLAAAARAVLIASPSPTHLPLTLRALAAGRYVLCEKPVAVACEQAARIAAADGESSGRVVGVGVCRFRPDVEQWLAWSRGVGELRRLRLSWLRGQGVPAPGSWHTRLAAGWTGVLADLGVHLLDLAVAVLDRPISTVVCRRKTEATSGAGSGASWYGGRDAVGYAVSDRVEAVLTVDGVEIELAVSWVDDRPGDLTELTVEGSEGRAELRGLFGFSDQRREPRQLCRLWRGGRLIEQRQFQPGPQLQRRAFGAMLEESANVCRGAEPRVGAVQIMATARLLEAVAEGVTGR